MLIQCDFDGAINKNNLSVLLRDNFVRGDWRRIETAYIQHSLTVEESNRQQYRLIELGSGFAGFINYLFKVVPDVVLGRRMAVAQSTPRAVSGIASQARRSSS